MAYEKQTFVNKSDTEEGTVLCAEHLEHMEQGISDAVSTTAQPLTDAQKQQARTNIGAVDVAYVDNELMQLGAGLYAFQACAVIWDGVIGDKPYVAMGNNMYFVCITEEVPTVMQEMPFAQLALSQLMDEEGVTIGVPVVLEDLGDGCWVVGSNLFIVPSDNYNMGNGIVLPKKGVYVIAMNELAHGMDFSQLYVSAVRVMGYSFTDKSGGDASKYFETVTETSVTEPGDTLTWDGVVGNRPYAEMVAGSAIQKVVLLADNAPTKDDFANGYSYTTNMNGTETETVVSAEDVYFQDITDADGAVVGLAAGSAISVFFDNVTADGITLPKAGLYLLRHDAELGYFYTSSFTIPGYNFTSVGTTEREIIKTEHLPEALRFGEFTTDGGDTLTWDGNEDGREYVDLAPGIDNVIAHMVYMSESAPALTDLEGKEITVALAVNGTFSKETCTIESEGVLITNDLISFFDGVVLVAWADNVSADGVALPKKGTYFANQVVPDMVVQAKSITIPGYTGFTKTEVKPIEPKYLPGPVVLYADAENYVCTDSAATQRITKDELKNLVLSGRSILCFNTQEEAGAELYGPIAVVAFADTYAVVYSQAFGGERFTAEYTLET